MNVKILDFFYLFSLYFKRGRIMSIFYVVMLTLGLLLPGFLLESNAKVSYLIDYVNEKLPPNRIKLGIPANVRDHQKPGLLTSLFKIKSHKANSNEVLKYKDFITPERLKQVMNIKGVSNIVPLYSIDFPMGIVFAIPGMNTPIQMQMIGSGIGVNKAKKFINKDAPYQKFVYTPGQPVPILMSRFIIPMVNTIAENNGVSNFKVSEKDLLGFKIKIFVGNSLLSNSFKNMGNAATESFESIGSNSFSENIEAVIVGFVDMDYSLGLSFPQNFLEKYKKQYWGNFKPGYYDSLVVDVPLSRSMELENKFQKQGFKIAQDTGILHKISQILQKQQEGFGLFLKFISFMILIFSFIILLYTILWILRGKTLEFSLYQFFGASRLKVVLLYNTYLTVLNTIAFIITTLVLKSSFSIIYHFIYQLRTRIPEEFQDIFEASFLKNFVIVDNFLLILFIGIQVVSFIIVYYYIKRLNNRM